MLLDCVLLVTEASRIEINVCRRVRAMTADMPTVNSHYNFLACHETYRHNSESLE